MQEQIAKNWCWAATVASIEEYLRTSDRESGERHTDVQNDKAPTLQCIVAAREINLSTHCCDIEIVGNHEQRHVHESWNVQNGLSMPLSRIGCHKFSSVGPPSEENVYENIEGEKLPICCRVVWQDELHGAHFVVISGYSRRRGKSGSDLMLRLDDSHYGQTLVSFERFLRAYQPNEIEGGGAKRGRVSHTYFLEWPSSDDT